MRVGIAVLLGLTVLVPMGRAEKEKPPARYGIAADLKAYPQDTPKAALASALKAIAAKRFDYLVAQLADPAFIDPRVKTVYAGKFTEQVEDTTARLGPLAIQQLQRFLKDGEWSVSKDRALVRHKALPRSCVRFRRLEGRWYLEHRSAPPPPPKKKEGPDA
jgi:hypothetical protein